MLDLKRLFKRGGQVARPEDVEPPHPMTTEVVLDRFVSADGKRRANVYRRHNGFFGFEEEIELYDDYSGLYWSPASGSGLYGTHEEALRDARAEIPWIRPLP